MQADYNSFINTLRDIYKLLLGITKSGLPDVIDITEVLTKPENFKDVFDVTQVTNPALTIANKEMYDFVTSHSRIPIMLKRPRSEWYIRAEDLYEKELRRFDRNVANMSKVLQHGDRGDNS